MHIVMAGIGLDAATRLVAKPDVRLTIGARSRDAVPAALAGAARILPLDLSDLDSVGTFADEAAEIVPTDVLIGNAGMPVARPRVSQQG